MNNYIKMNAKPEEDQIHNRDKMETDKLPNNFVYLPHIHLVFQIQLFYAFWSLYRNFYFNKIVHFDAIFGCKTSVSIYLRVKK